MTSLTGGVRLLVAAIVLLGSVAPVDAQLIRTRPFRGIFRTTQDPAASKDSVDVSVFLLGGHDEASFELGDVDLPRDDRLSTATFGTLFLSGSYAHKGDSNTFSARASSATRYYPDALRALSPMNFNGGVRFAGRVGRRGTVNLGQTFGYSPYYSFSLSPAFLAEIEPDEELAPTLTPVFDPETDLRATRRATYAYGSAASYAQRVGRRSHLQFRYNFNYTDAVEGAYDLMAHGAGVRYSHSIGRYANVYGGYGARRAAYVDSPFGEVVAHDVDGGIGYARTLPFSRRTRIAFSIGSGLATQEQSTRVFVTANASVLHRFTRTWSAWLAYNRGNDVLQGFAAPFLTFTDSIAVAVSGRVAGPVSLSASGAYTHGTFSVQSARNVVDSGVGSVRLNVPVIWFLNLYVEGYYAEYRFRQRLGLLPDVPAAVDRFGTRAGLSFWLPVLR